MEKKYLAKIIANDNQGLQMISACCTGSKVKISDIKYLQSNKIFLLLVALGQHHSYIKRIC